MAGRDHAPMRPVEHALALAALGLSVMPLHRATKLAAVKWKPFQTAHATPDQIRKWWSRWPEANPAAITGAISGVWVLDIDGDDGRASLARWIDRYGALPRTWRTITRRGEHFWFRWPADRVVRNTSGVVAPHVDVRGRGGLIVAPGSIHASGHVYTWATDGGPETVPLAPAPGWLLDRVAPRLRPPAMVRPLSAPAVAGTWPRRLVERIVFDELAALARTGEGGRNATLNLAAFRLGRLVAGGAMPESWARHALAVAASSAGLPAPEIAATISSGLTAGLASPRNPPPR